MPKKRLIFTLLYQKGAFFLSRNFKLQRVGDIDWLKNNYHFASVSKSIDELVIIDVSREDRDAESFCAIASKLTEDCFIPVVLGGGIRSVKDASMLIECGAEKLIINSLVVESPETVRELVRIFGSQSIVCSIDYKYVDNRITAYSHQGTRAISGDFSEYMRLIESLDVGEIYLNSIDRDGSGQGYILESIERLGSLLQKPITLSGGAGNKFHMKQAFGLSDVDAVATANLFNFMGNGLPDTRHYLLNEGIDMARW